MIEHFDMLAEALGLAALGWDVFPLNGKQPATKHGFHDATTDYDQIVQWWTWQPRANIGIAIPPGMIVIDIDPRHNGADNFAVLTKAHGPIPETVTVITGRRDGGSHLYLNCPTERLSQQRLPEGVDLRAGGKHYVVAPPSVHPDTGWTYEWFDPECVIADAPRWLIDLLRVPPAPSWTPPAASRALTGDKGAALVDFVAALTEGNRNAGLFWAICRAITDGCYPAIRDDLKRAALSIGLSEREVEMTAASAERRAA